YKPLAHKLRDLHARGHFNPVFFNDGRMVMEYVSKRLHQLDPKLMKQMREPGLEYFQDNDIYAHFISGQGANGAVGRLVRQESGEFNLEDYHSYEPAHLSMPLYDKEPNCFIEGEGRIAMLDSVTGSQAPAEYYVAGCPDKKTHIGPTATILNLIQKCQKDPQVVVDTFNDLFASWHEQGLFEGCASPNKYSLFLKYILGSEGDQQNPASGLSYFTAHPDQQTTRGLGIQAKDGNRAAQAVLLFSAYRQADFMIESLRNENYNGGNPTRVLTKTELQDGNTEAKGRLKLVTYTGGLARGYHDDYPDCWNLIQNRLRRAFGEQVELVYVEPQAKFDGAIELAEDVVSSKISYPIVTEPKTNQWTDWASAQIKKFTELKLSL
ncbi:MAG: hypothetical protein OXU45_06515, partial [Candidatus Melainabacteria bacterium]|nr:hypothetical protein [Candidatus Melainabacteria bacterium]